MDLKMYYNLTYSNGVEVKDQATRVITIDNQILPQPKRFEETELYAMDKRDAWNFLNEQYNAPIKAIGKIGIDGLGLRTMNTRFHNNMIYMSYTIWDYDEDELGSQGAIEFGRHSKRSDSDIMHYSLRVAECEDPNYPWWSKDAIFEYEWKERE